MLRLGNPSLKVSDQGQALESRDQGLESLIRVHKDLFVVRKPPERGHKNRALVFENKVLVLEDTVVILMGNV